LVMLSLRKARHCLPRSLAACGSFAGRWQVLADWLTSRLAKPSGVLRC
jgi:hypothetical protein